MEILRYRRWHPPESPLRIEFAADLPNELRPGLESVETTGLLYGLRHGHEVRVVSSQPDRTTELVGILVSRPRGEVFLTESNLELFEKQKALVALVIAGERAGFFVRDRDGFLQTVRSYEEFPIEEPATIAMPPAPIATPPRARNWTRVAGVGALIALPVAALAYLRPHAPLPSSNLAVREKNGQLHISWQRGDTAVLEIADGAEKTSIPVFPDQSGVTYLRRGPDVEVSLVRLDSHGSRRTETARFVGAPLPLSSTEQLRARVAQLKSDVRKLRSEIAANRAHAELLNKKLAGWTTRAP